MQRSFLAALDRITPRPPGEITVITARAAAFPIDRFTAEGALGAGDLALWDAPAADADGGSWSYVGRGAAARVEGEGSARIEAIRRGADEIFARVIEHRDRDVAAPPVRLFGGIAFRVESTRAAPWSAFADASFALPRWVYGTNGEQAFLRLAMAAGDTIDRTEIEAVCARFGDASETSPRRASDASGARVERTSPTDWAAMIEDALACIRSGALEKVVPAARCRAIADHDFDIAAALAELRANYAACARFAFQRGEATFLGATPERLVARRGRRVETDALAGSRARDRDDEAAVAALLASEKDRREHRLVVDAIAAALRPFASALDVAESPVVRTLRNVHHLWTPIAATLDRPAHVLDLVAALHPTPAVCGAPREAAIAWISAHERAPRGWYSGAVGSFDAEGDGAFSVAIRSGVVAGREAWLYAGAGIVAGSDAGAEYAETGVKHAPMLAALGLAP